MDIIDQQHHPAIETWRGSITYIRPVIEKMSKIQVNLDFDVDDYELLYQVTALLRIPLQGKMVTLVAGPKDVCLSPCVGFRCESINFWDCEEAGYRDSVKAVIESGTIVQDTVYPYTQFWNKLNKSRELPVFRGKYFAEVYEGELGDVSTCLLSWDLPGFHKCKAIYWNVVKAWMEVWSVAERERINDQKKRILERFSGWHD